MRAMLRLAGWGVAAASALLIAALAAHSPGGQQRMSIAIATLTGQAKVQVAKADTAKADAERAAKADRAKEAAANAAQLARLTATEGDTRRLTEMVRTLSTDRERLVTRVTALERNLEDVTGSIRRPAAAPAPAAPPSSPPTSQPTGALPPPARVATVPPDNAAAEPGPAAATPALGIDIGGAANFDGLRKLWNSLVADNAGLFDGLHPVVIVRENSKSRAADLRIIVGPLEGSEAAARICATLAAAKRSCRPVAFEGQPLAMTAPEPPRRPRAAPERKASQRPPAFPN